MKTCQKCESPRIVEVCGKTSDLCSITIHKNNTNGYVPDDMGIATPKDAGDYIHFRYCLDCGQIQGTWPKPLTKMENPKSTE